MHRALKDALLLVTSAVLTEVAFRGIPDGGRRRRPGAWRLHIVFGYQVKVLLFSIMKACTSRAHAANAKAIDLGDRTPTLGKPKSHLLHLCAAA